MLPEKLRDAFPESWEAPWLLVVLDVCLLIDESIDFVVKALFLFKPLPTNGGSELFPGTKNLKDFIVMNKFWEMNRRSVGTTSASCLEVMCRGVALLHWQEYLVSCAPHAA